MKSYYLEPNKDYHNKEQSVDASDTLLEDTVQYYEDCHNDYLFAWCNRQNLALHYGYWDAATPYKHHQALLNTNRVLYESAQIKPSDHILDAGCGLGGSSLWIANEYNNKVTGITLSEKQALYANRHAQKRGLTDSVNFAVANFCATDFP
ncbi:MAG: methyltransferase domain-containing protein, partial [Methyloprofundus sp.]|nr:methyltransferase domain-containing protein [Methyloprofundus sp.]